MKARNDCTSALNSTVLGLVVRKASGGRRFDGHDRKRQLSPEVANAMHDLNATFAEVIGEQLSPSVEREHRALVESFNQFMGVKA